MSTSTSKPTIPEIRDMMYGRLGEMRELASELGGLDRAAVEDWCERFEELIEATRRRSPVRVAPKRRRPLTEEEIMRVRVYAKRHPNASQQEIANVFGINPGRVSEALAGFRDGREVGEVRAS